METPAPTRTLNVELISATGLKDTELIGKSDPYVVLSIGKTERKSKVAKDQPTSPAWNETFTLPVLDTDLDKDLKVVIKNDDTLGRDEEMGLVLIPLSLIHGRSHSASTFPLELKGKPHGEIILSLSFEGEGHAPHHETHGLTEQVQGLSVGDKPEHHEGEPAHPEGGHHGGLKEKIAGLKEKRHRKKERKHRGSGDEGGSSSSSESDKSDKGE
jgi:Ca2+-dependent lipid-binding protein